MPDGKGVATEAAKMKNRATWAFVTKKVFEAGFRRHEATEAVGIIWGLVKAERRRLRSAGLIQNRNTRSGG